MALGLMGCNAFVFCMNGSWGGVAGEDVEPPPLPGTPAAGLGTLWPDAVAGERRMGGRLFFAVWPARLSR